MRQIHALTLSAAALAAAALAAAAPAAATTAVALVGDRGLVALDLETGEATAAFEITGGARILGIDWRPADRGLYAVTEAGDILKVDVAARAAEPVARTDVTLPVSGPVAMDFNPAADKLRLMSGVTNHRIDPDSGATTVDGDLHFGPEADLDGQTPMIVATAYTNAFGRPEETAQYGIDAGLGALVRQTAPNDGVLAPVGPLGIPASETYAFDIATDASGANTGWLVAGGALHEVSLEDGSVTANRPLPPQAVAARDFTVLSDM